jgi:hypothetical protein
MLLDQILQQEIKIQNFGFLGKKKNLFTNGILKKGLN